MTTLSHDTVPTSHVDVGGDSFAYRRFGHAATRLPPIVLVQHFRGNLDNFDPAVTDALAREREVVLFDNRGVAGSNGAAPTTVEQMAHDTAAFVDALDLRQIDLFGFSMGGEVAQLVALERPELVRRLVLVGTGPRGGEGMAQMRPTTAALFARVTEPADEMWLPIMFSPSLASQAAGRVFLARTRARTDRDGPVSAATATAHGEAAGHWGEQRAGAHDYLRSIHQPTLIVNGSDDVVIPTVNSYLMQQSIPDARLVLYPDSNHGSHFQYTTHFNRELRGFLSD